MNCSRADVYVQGQRATLVANVRQYESVEVGTIPIRDHHLAGNGVKQFNIDVQLFGKLGRS